MRWLHAAVILVAGSAATAPADDIEADRPGFGESANVVDRGHVQLEAGVAWTRVDRESSVLDLPEALLRIGVGASLEVRVQPSDWLRSAGPAGPHSGWSDSSIGLRWQVAAGSHDLSLRGTLYAPNGSTPWSDDKVDPEVAVSWAHDLLGGWSASATVSAHRFTFVETTVLSPSLSIEHALGSRGTAFLEYGASAADGRLPLHQVDHGYTWLPNPRTQLDVSIGFGLWSAAPDFFVAAGVSRRF